MPPSLRKVVLCHGVFDCLHPGYLYLFDEARKHGNYLMVSIVGDKFVHKGPGRPVFNETERTVMLSALRIVDEVVITTTVKWWEAHAQTYVLHTYVRGDEGKTPPEIKFFSSLGAQLVFVPKLPGYSTTHMLNRIRPNKCGQLC